MTTFCPQLIVWCHSSNGNNHWASVAVIAHASLVVAMVTRKYIYRSENVPQSGTSIRGDWVQRRATWLAALQILGRFQDAIDILNWPFSISFSLCSLLNNQSQWISNHHWGISMESQIILDTCRNESENLKRSHRNLIMYWMYWMVTAIERGILIGLDVISTCSKKITTRDASQS